MDKNGFACGVLILLVLVTQSAIYHEEEMRAWAAILIAEIEDSDCVLLKNESQRSSGTRNLLCIGDEKALAKTKKALVDAVADAEKRY